MGTVRAWPGLQGGFLLLPLVFSHSTLRTVAFVTLSWSHHPLKLLSSPLLSLREGLKKLELRAGPSVMGQPPSLTFPIFEFSEYSIPSTRHEHPCLPAFAGVDPPSEMPTPFL